MQTLSTPNFVYGSDEMVLGNEKGTKIKMMEVAPSSGFKPLNFVAPKPNSVSSTPGDVSTEVLQGTSNNSQKLVKTTKTESPTISGVKSTPEQTAIEAKSSAKDVDLTKGSLPDKNVQKLTFKQKIKAFRDLMKLKKELKKQNKLNPKGAKEAGGTFAILGMVFGLLGLMLFWLPFVGLIFGLIGVVFSVLGLMGTEAGDSGKIFSIVGLIAGSLAVIFGLLWLVAFATVL